MLKNYGVIFLLSLLLLSCSVNFQRKVEVDGVDVTNTGIEIDSAISATTGSVDSTVASTSDSDPFESKGLVRIQYSPRYFEEVNRLIAENPLGFDKLLIGKYAVSVKKKLILPEDHIESEMLGKEVMLYAEYATLADS